MAPAAPEVMRVAETIQRSFALDDRALPEVFRPAHLAVALIDAVFASGLAPGETPEPAVALVRAAAYELVLAPRHVDHAIWRAARAADGASGGER